MDYSWIIIKHDKGRVQLTKTKQNKEEIKSAERTQHATSNLKYEHDMSYSWEQSIVSMCQKERGRSRNWLSAPTASSSLCSALVGDRAHFARICGNRKQDITMSCTAIGAAHICCAPLSLRPLLLSSSSSGAQMQPPSSSQCGSGRVAHRCPNTHLLAFSINIPGLSGNSSAVFAFQVLCHHV